MDTRLHALAGLLELHLARARAFEDRARRLRAVGRLADDRDEDLAERGLVLEVRVAVLLEHARASGEPSDEREPADDRERAHRDAHGVLPDLLAAEDDVADDEERAEHRTGERALRAIRPSDLARLPDVASDHTD